MEEHRVRNWIIRGVLVCVLAWVTFSLFYAHYTKKRFTETLSPLPPVSLTGSQDATEPSPQQIENTGADTAPAQLTETEPAAAAGDTTPLAEEATVESDVEMHPPHTHPHPHVGEDIHSHPHLHGSMDHIPPEFAHLDPLVVKEGYTDYNRYRYSDPERAYERLAETFRYMFGDSPAIERYITFVRKADRGPLTFDEVIEMNNTHIEMVPSSMAAGIVHGLTQQNERLEQLRLDGIAFGVPPEEMVINYRFIFQND